jgi:hypothetical protein
MSTSAQQLRLGIHLTVAQVEQLDRRAKIAGTTRLEMLRRILRNELWRGPAWVTRH